MTPEQRDARVAEALAEFLDRASVGETPDPEAFSALHPDLAPDLLAQLRASAEIDTILEIPALSKAADHLSGHRILRELGSGGMGRVFLAFDESLKREVAIKTLHPRYAQHPQLRARFLREAQSLARLKHPNIVQIHSLGPAGEEPHFVMELVAGAPLTEAARPLDLRQKAELMHKVLLAVDFLHQNQLIHRDLKPANILVAGWEPKLLDLGLALPTEESGRLSLDGGMMGTPDYFAPEQARGGISLDARSDIFSLGIVFYELLTGSRPFRGETLLDHLANICEQDPILPRRLNPNLPGALQDVCLKALEKDPANRYRSAREMADDLERYLAGEPVLAAPTAYPRLMAEKIEQHLRELDAWRRDRVLSEGEHDAFRKTYGRLTEREDAWIMEVRRMSLSQVSLYLGAWILVLGTTLIVFSRYTRLNEWLAAALAVGAAVPTGWIGIWRWKSGHLRIAVADLLAFCLLLPLALLAVMHRVDLFAGFTRGDKAFELFDGDFPTNAQMWWAITLALPAYYWLRHFTRSSVFSLVLSAMGALLCGITLLRMGLADWIKNDLGQAYFHLIPFAILFLVIGRALEHFRLLSDSRYFYPIAVGFTWAAMSGVAAQHKPYAEWLGATAPWTHGQVAYLFIVNAGIYTLLQALCEHFSTPQLRGVAKAFRFIIPGHVLTSLLVLGLKASELWNNGQGDAAYRVEARVFEILLPIAACGFVFGSLPKQMKNFFAMGLVFLAIGVVRLHLDLFKDHSLWPISLLVTGMLLMLAATRYARLKLAFSRFFR